MPKIGLCHYGHELVFLLVFPNEETVVFGCTSFEQLLQLQQVFRCLFLLPKLEFGILKFYPIALDILILYATLLLFAFHKYLFVKIHLGNLHFPIVQKQQISLLKILELEKIEEPKIIADIVSA